MPTFSRKHIWHRYKRVEKGSGSVWFKKPGKMLWEYKTPQAQKIILDGKNLWFYVPEDKQVMKNNFSTIPQHIVVDLFRGKIAIQEKFKVSFIQEEMKNSRKEISLELIPLAYDPTVKKLTALGGSGKILHPAHLP